MADSPNSPSADNDDKAWKALEQKLKNSPEIQNWIAEQVRSQQAIREVFKSRSANRPHVDHMISDILDQALRKEDRMRVNPDLAEPSNPQGFRNRAYSWLKRYAGWAFVGAAIGMAGLGEYAVGMALLIVAFFAFAIQIFEWTGHFKRKWMLGLVKAVWFLSVAGMLVFFVAVFHKMKQSKPWSNLLPEAVAPDSGQLPSPFATPTSEGTKSETNKSKAQPTLVELFKSDLSNTMKFFDEDRIGIQWQNGEELHIKTQVYVDFPAKTQFVGFYVPSSKNTYQASLRLVTAVHETITSLRKKVRLSAGYQNERTSLEELVFSGRVYLYHEDFLSITEKAAIIKAYKQKRYDVQFRGPEYLGDQIIAWHRKHDAK